MTCDLSSWFRILLPTVSLSLNFRVFAGNHQQQLDHHRISDFRLVHCNATAPLIVQVLRL
jgi:hypothetical protein